MKRKILLLVVVNLVVFNFAPVQAQEKTKVSGSELVHWLSKYTAYAGTNDLNGCVFMVVSHSSDHRTMFYDCPANKLIESIPVSGIGKGTARVDGDRLCETWADIYPGWEQCEEVYRVGDNQHEQLNGTKKFYMLK